jgi:hypothetical protein
MKKWERIVDRLVTDAIGDGDVSHLSGAGKKLPPQQDRNTPSEFRAAFKIMNDHQVMPDWITAGKQLEQTETKLRRRIQLAAQGFKRNRARTDKNNSPASLAKVESIWKRNQADILERVERYNREVLTYNLTLPSGIPHRQQLQGAILIEQALRNDQ